MNELLSIKFYQLFSSAHNMNLITKCIHVSVHVCECVCVCSEVKVRQGLFKHLESGLGLCLLVPLLDLADDLAQDGLVVPGAELLQEVDHQGVGLLLHVVDEVGELVPDLVVPLVEALAKVLLLEGVLELLVLLLELNALRLER